jgi:hypothetical protein
MKALRATTHAISDAGLNKIAPAIFANEPDFEVSDRYAFVPTIDVVNALRQHGWYPSEVRAQTVRGRHADHAKHQIRFRQPGTGPLTARREVGDTHFEVVLTNSHDRTSGFQLDAGLFRLVCSNGMTVKDQNLGSISVRHVGEAPQLITEGVDRIVTHIPRLQDAIEQWSTIQLDERSQLILANRAAELRWGSPEQAPLQAFRLLQTRRWADNSNDLWSVFNRVQENVIRGGQRGIGSTGRRVGIRAVGAIDADRRINQGLWETATELANAA